MGTNPHNSDNIWNTSNAGRTDQTRAPGGDLTGHDSESFKPGGRSGPTAPPLKTGPAQPGNPGTAPANNLSSPQHHDSAVKAAQGVAGTAGSVYSGASKASDLPSATKSAMQNHGGQCAG